jgi:hypothetical protein
MHRSVSCSACCFRCMHAQLLIVIVNYVVAPTCLSQYSVHSYIHHIISLTDHNAHTVKYVYVTEFHLILIGSSCCCTPPFEACNSTAYTHVYCTSSLSISY